MNKKFFTLICFMITIPFAWAQEVDPERELIQFYKREIENLKSDKKLYEHKIDSLSNLIKQLKRDSIRLSRETHEIASIRANADRYKRERDSLATAIKKLHKEHPAQVELNGLCEDTAELNAYIKNKDVQIRKKDSIIAARNQELASLKKFKVEYIATLAKKVDEKWFKYTFAEIHDKATELDADIQLYMKFQDDDQSVGNASRKIQALKQDYKTYLSATEILNAGPYDKQRVDQLVSKVKDIVQRTAHPERKAEMDSLYTSLCQYTQSVKDFKKIIEIISINAKDPDAIRRRLETRLSDYVSSVKQIPWLAKEYDIYLNEITKTDNSDTDYTNPATPNTIASRIHKLKTE